MQNVTGKFDSSQNAIVYLDANSEKISSMFLLEGDNRAAAIRAARGFTAPHIFSIWSSLIEVVKPDLILDIGANHGEITLPLRIPEGCLAILFEPNPKLAAILHRSILTHLDCSRIQIRNEAVSSEIGSAAFMVDNKWSGTSSLDFKSPDAEYKGVGPQSYDENLVKTVPLFSLFDSNSKKVAIKIDVEGHEQKILERGKDSLLLREYVIIAEIVKDHLIKAGSSFSEFFDLLSSLGSVFAVERDGKLVHVASAHQMWELRRTTTDVLVTNNELALRSIRSQ